MCLNGIFFGLFCFVGHANNIFDVLFITDNGFSDQVVRNLTLSQLITISIIYQTGVNVSYRKLRHKRVYFMRCVQRIWLWQVINGGLSSPVLILGPHTFLWLVSSCVRSPTEPRWRFLWHPKHYCAHFITSVPLPASHTELMCLSSYSQANPPPIIVNADSLDAGPYVSIFSRCLLYSKDASYSDFLFCMDMFVCLCVEKKPSPS